MKKTKCIMVADDDPAILDAIGTILEFKGYEVKQMLNGEGVMQMKDELPDLLLLDIWMSGIDGRDICKKLKEMPATSQIPIILVSASKDIAKSALEAGADDFLADIQSPVTPSTEKTIFSYKIQ
jgi:CheY-like chemotaxis protein